MTCRKACPWPEHASVRKNPVWDHVRRLRTVGYPLDVGAYRGEVFFLLRHVLPQALGLRRRPRSLQPERLEGRVDGLFVHNVGVRVTLELQVGSDGASFLLRKDRQAI